jgi:hypothetical protein
MSMRASRSTVLMSALALSLFASLWTWWRGAASEELALPLDGRPGTAAQATPAPVPSPLSAAGAEAPGATQAPVLDLFAPVSWETAPDPAPAAPPAPTAPAAPPMPFEYVGRTEVVGGPGTVVHLRRGTELYSVSEGASIDEQYKLHKIGADALEIDYLPMSLRQTLSTGIK